MTRDMSFEGERSWKLKHFTGLVRILKKNRMTGGVIIQINKEFNGLINLLIYLLINQFMN